MTPEQREELRLRKNAEFDGEAHLTNDELESLLADADALAECQRELAAQKPAADAWNYLMNGIEALCDLPEHEPDKKTDAYITAWQKLQAALAAAQARERGLRELSDALESLLVCYRTGRRPSDSMLDKIAKLKQEAAEGG